ncbi:MAG: hypothetical protein EZS28_016009 [Streblomastix strix]|uniref:Uncharacterized protein n=1 Tax=Streblomastix strix TaxID=222440 RepID=A0A5J4W0U5_9EUKA|nr:MAG: hypothetical protein EZS28_016009 [Streblomastix strix]
MIQMLMFKFLHKIQSQIVLSKLKQTLSTFTTLPKSNFNLHPFITLVVTYNIEFLQLNPRLISIYTKDSSISVSFEAAQAKADIALITLAKDTKVKAEQKYQLTESELILQTFKMSEVCRKNELQNNASSDFTLKDTDTLKSISSKKLIVKCRLETYDKKQSVCLLLNESAQLSESQQLSEQQ